MARHPFAHRKPGRRPARRAAARATFASIHPVPPPSSERGNHMFLLLLYLAFALGSGLFLALVYAVLSKGGL